MPQHKQTDKTIMPHAYYISGCKQWAAAVAIECFTTTLSMPLFNVAVLSFCSPSIVSIIVNYSLHSS